jgi:hypothetical protein
MNNDNTNTNINATLLLINETYDKLTYFDLYGNSVILFLFLTLFVFVVFSYCQVLQTKEAIADDWINQRCKPQNMFFAGLITHPEGTTPLQYTSDNFQYCIQSILTDVSEYALRPFQFMISSITAIFLEISNSLQRIREMIHNIRSNFAVFGEDVMGRLLQIMTPMQKTLITVMDTFQKIQGVMTGGLYTMLGSYYTLRSLMGAILEMITKILMALVIVIMGLWIMPMTWPAAASMTAVFSAIAIPLSIIVYFMTEVLHIHSSAVPQLRCFDEDTPISLYNDNKKGNKERKIKDIQVGDKLANGSYVTAKIKVTSQDMPMYTIGQSECKDKGKDNIVVSGSHLIQYQNTWIRVGNHPHATRLSSYDKPFLYCLNTSDKVIPMGSYLFSDWDENVVAKENMGQWIHEYVHEGFEESECVGTLGTLGTHHEPKIKKIVEVQIGDMVGPNSMVYGLVEIETTNKFRKYGNTLSPPKLFHLLTTDGTFTIVQKEGKEVKEVNDYNFLIDKFII